MALLEFHRAGTLVLCLSRRRFMGADGCKRYRQLRYCVQASRLGSPQITPCTQTGGCALQLTGKTSAWLVLRSE